MPGFAKPSVFAGVRPSNTSITGDLTVRSSNSLNTSDPYVRPSNISITSDQSHVTSITLVPHVTPMLSSPRNTTGLPA